MTVIVPRVSVVMSVYNGERYLREAVDSILNQTFEDFEFIIINDGSTDGTREILESYRDPRIRLFHQQNIGMCRSWNKGLALALGEYIARMDADDISLPERLESQMRLFEQRPEVSVVGCAARVIGGKTQGVWMPDFTETTLPARALVGCPLAHGTVVFRRDEVIGVGAYDERFPIAEDYELWVRLAWQGYKFGGVKRVLYLLRKHEASISVRKSAIQKDSAFKARIQTIRMFRRNPAAFAWVDAKALRASLFELYWAWRNHGHPTPARQAALAMIGLNPRDMLAYKLFASTLPGAARLRTLIRRARAGRIREGVAK